MAIHQDFPGIEVTVEGDGTSVVEYADLDDQVKHEDAAVQLHLVNCTVAKYIECATGKHFSIKMAIDAKYKWDCPVISFHVWVDGVSVGGSSFSRTSYENINSDTVKEGIYVGNTGHGGVLKKFKFAEIHTTSDFVDATTIREDKARLSKVGEVIVKVYRDSKAKPAKNNHFHSNFNSYEKVVHEKAVKGEAKSHGIMFGDHNYLEIPKFFRSKHLDGENYPIALFKFKYRSNEALKQLLVIERTPEPQDLNLFNGLTVDEKREVEEFAQILKRKRGIDPPVNQEDRRSVDRANTLKRLRSTDLEIFDLSED